MRRIWVLLLLAVLGVPAGYVAWQALLTLRVLEQVEAERDTWQRPDAVVAALDLLPGQSVVDFGSGAGYFALKLAPIVGPAGSVLAVELRRESLAFLWIRARVSGYGQLRVIHGAEHDPHLPGAPVDAVLIANTYHELSAPQPMIALLRERLKPGGRLVVLDRAPRHAGGRPPESAAAHHELAPGIVEADIRSAGFTILTRNDRFIDRVGDDDIWWLIVAKKP